MHDSFFLQRRCMMLISKVSKSRNCHLKLDLPFGIVVKVLRISLAFGSLGNRVKEKMHDSFSM